MGERAERESLRAQEATNNMIEELDRTHLRKIQGKSYRCSVKCCEDSDLSIKEVYRCVASCNRSLSEAQVYCEKELKDSQDRVTRCVLDCNDRIKDKLLPETSEAEVRKLEIEFDGCVAKCVDAHIASLPTLLNRMKSVLQSKLES